MSQCEHKTEAEYGICNRCKSFARIARDAKAVLEARKAYMDQLLIDPKASDPAQEALQERLKRLEESVKFADMAKLWDDEKVVPVVPVETFPPKACNRHDDCRAAVAEYTASHGKAPGVNFHCWSEDCEDCFGK
jgi:hypothetical protein